MPLVILRKSRGMAARPSAGLVQQGSNSSDLSVAHDRRLALSSRSFPVLSARCTCHSTWQRSCSELLHSASWEVTMSEEEFDSAPSDEGAGPDPVRAHEPQLIDPLDILSRAFERDRKDLDMR